MPDEFVRNGSQGGQAMLVVGQRRAYRHLCSHVSEVLPAPVPTDQLWRIRALHMQMLSSCPFSYLLAGSALPGSFSCLLACPPLPGLLAGSLFAYLFSQHVLG